jgi:hypothetical protein
VQLDPVNHAARDDGGEGLRLRVRARWHWILPQIGRTQPRQVGCIEHPEELQARLGGLPQIGGGLRRPHGLTFHQHLERRTAVIDSHWLRASRVAIENCCGRSDLHHDRRAGVASLELAHLPLAGQEPERIVRARLEPGFHVLRPCPRLHAIPDRDR